MSNMFEQSTRSRKGFSLDEPTIVDSRVVSLRDLLRMGRITGSYTNHLQGRGLGRRMVTTYEAYLNNGKRSWVITESAYRDMTSRPVEITEWSDWDDEDAELNTRIDQAVEQYREALENLAAR